MIKLCVPDITEREVAAVTEVLRSGWLAEGPVTRGFEQRFAERVGVRHAIACNSCTSALFLVLKSLDLDGDVIVPSFSFVASANAVVTAGLRPRFVDIEYGSCNLDPDRVRAAITPTTRAILCVHFAGQCCRMDALAAIAREHNLPLIEDSAETLGATFRGRPAGSFGIGCFSFYPVKNITTGEGGMITTDDDALAEHLRTLVGHGIPASAHARATTAAPWQRDAVVAGYNFRLSDVLAALGTVQLDRLDEMNQARRRVAAQLDRGLAGLSGVEGPTLAPGCDHVYQMYTVKLAAHLDRDAIVRRLRAAGIGASVHFSPPIHQQRFYRQHPEWIGGPLAVTEEVARRILTLPLYPTLTEREVELIVGELGAALG